MERIPGGGIGHHHHHHHQQQHYYPTPTTSSAAAPASTNYVEELAARASLAAMLATTTQRAAASVNVDFSGCNPGGGGGSSSSRGRSSTGGRGGPCPTTMASSDFSEGDNSDSSETERRRRRQRKRRMPSGGLGFASLGYPTKFDPTSEEAALMQRVQEFLATCLDQNGGALPYPRPNPGISSPFNTHLNALKKNRLLDLPDQRSMPDSVRAILAAAFPGYITEGRRGSKGVVRPRKMKRRNDWEAFEKAYRPDSQAWVGGGAGLIRPDGSSFLAKPEPPQDVASPSLPMPPSDSSHASSVGSLRGDRNGGGNRLIPDPSVKNLQMPTRGGGSGFSPYLSSLQSPGSLPPPQTLPPTSIGGTNRSHHQHHHHNHHRDEGGYSLGLTTPISQSSSEQQGQPPQAASPPFFPYGPASLTPAPPVYPLCVSLTGEGEARIESLTCTITSGSGPGGIQLLGPQGVITGAPLRCLKVAMSLLLTMARCVPLVLPGQAQPGLELRHDIINPSNRVTVRVDFTPTHADANSLGVAFFLALLVTFTTARLRPRIAVAGELCLTGRLESTTDPVVRLRAVERSEAVALVLPRANKREVDSLSGEARRLSKVHYVSDMFELLNDCLDTGFRPAGVRPWPLGRDDILGIFGRGHAVLFNDNTCLTFDVECCAHVGTGEVIITGMDDEGDDDQSGGLATGGGSNGAGSNNNVADSTTSAARSALQWVMMEQEWIRELFGKELRYDFRCMVDTSPSPSRAGATMDLHIHFPKAVDTSWYGCAIALALVSLLTGEKTLGKVGVTATVTHQGVLGSTRYYTRVGQGAVANGIQTLLWVRQMKDNEEGDWMFPPEGQMVPPQLRMAPVVDMRDAVRAAFGRRLAD